MALEESLAKFKKQQEKCQSTLASINNARAGSFRAAASPHDKSVPIATSASIAVKAPAIKFSYDTQRLQYINSVQKSTIGAQLKRVVDLLREIECTYVLLTTADWGRLNLYACYVDATNNKMVFDSLTSNDKVYYDGKRFSYKPKYGVKNKEELCQFILKYPEGIRIGDLSDAYPKVMEDLQALKASGAVWLLSNSDSREDVAYPNDPKIDIKVDYDLKSLFIEIDLPHDMIDIERYLQKNKMKPATNTARRRAMAQVQSSNPKPKAKKKTRDISKRTKLTNAHLPELFQNFNVP
ncbi:general transcription factor IIE subunit 2-like isoform X2 [Papaver somniferum]|uniref:general transcription factor IIE subunit 2-like isoform X2 n=1 Tax=Papaver somniferum TaxID=3469 RepID=UPI000E6F555B|nr:general transcription factor IIE subunit 2-like isoform X2 [Papaver somniferum]